VQGAVPVRVFGTGNGRKTNPGRRARSVAMMALRKSEGEQPNASSRIR
jgi:hypothetical protein